MQTARSNQADIFVLHMSEAITSRIPLLIMAAAAGPVYILLDEQQLMGRT
jgi:hypothetical protein